MALFIHFTFQYSAMSVYFEYMECRCPQYSSMRIEPSKRLYRLLCFVSTPPTYRLFSVQAPGGHELQVDFWSLVCSSPAGGAEAEINKEAHPDVQLDKRHLLLRGENCSKVGGGVNDRKRSSLI